MYELTQLRCFVAVAEELHFRRAAARLNMTQPPLSRQIQLLEHDLGVRLLDRNRRGVQLTHVGRAFFRSARQILEIAEDAALDARRTFQGDAGSVAIGFTASSSYAFLPKLVSALRTALPHVDLSFREMVTVDQLEALQAGQIDFGLVRPPVTRAGVESVRVHREPLLAALPSGHKLANRPAIAIEELSGESLITYPPVVGRYMHDLITSLFHVAGVAPRQTQYVDQTHSILALVGADLGVAVVPQAVEELQPRSVVLRPLATEASVQAELLLAWRSGSDNPACAAVLAVLQKALPAIRRR